MWTWHRLAGAVLSARPALRIETLFPEQTHTNKENNYCYKLPLSNQGKMEF